MNQRRLLQIVVVIASLVPIAAGGAGMLLGPAFVGAPSGPIAADSHFRYLSGLLLGIGIAFVMTVPRIETRTARFRILASIVVIGGLGRLLSLILRGPPEAPMQFALVMELLVTPALALWQARVAALARTPRPVEQSAPGGGVSPPSTASRPQPRNS